MKDFESLRAKLQHFCNERSWHEFHTPTNILIALAGEAGELCEIFQWKGILSSSDILNNITKKEDLFNEKELINIGEEIADVFIYSCRFCDLCSINLAEAIIHFLAKEKNVEIDTKLLTIPTGESWTPYLSFDELDVLTQEVIHSPSFPTFSSSNSHLSLPRVSSSPRTVVLGVQYNIGKASALFAAREEVDSKLGLTCWSAAEKSELAMSIASICVLLSILSRIFNIKLSDCITDKIAKNEKKYPAAEVKGSSKKYNEYKFNNAAATTVSSSISSKFNPFGLSASVLIGTVFGFLFSSLRAKNLLKP